MYKTHPSSPTNHHIKSATNIRISEREISSLLEYLSPRAEVYSRFTSNIRISEREISSLLEYLSPRAEVYSRLNLKYTIILWIRQFFHGIMVQVTRLRQSSHQYYICTQNRTFASQMQHIGRYLFKNMNYFPYLCKQFNRTRI